MQQIDRELKQSLTVAIGPQTREALEKEDISVDIVSKELTIPSLIETIIDYYDIYREMRNRAGTYLIGYLLLL